jgi:phospholipid transport system substrate-binding protein
MACLLLLQAHTASAQYPYYQQPGYGGYGYQHQQQYRHAIPPAYRQSGHPAATLREGISKLIVFLQGDTASPEQLRAFVNREMAPYFDFKYMAKYAAGAQGRNMSAEDQKQLQTKIRNLFLESMVEKLSGYSHSYVRYLPVRSKPDTGEVTISIQAYSQGNPRPNRLDFRMYKSRQGWKVFDVMANGQSAVAFYRSYFSSKQRQPAYESRYPQETYGYNYQGRNYRY